MSILRRTPSRVVCVVTTVVMILGIASGRASVAAPAPSVPASPPSVLNVDPSTTVGDRAVYAATDAQRAALGHLETDAIASVVAEHGLGDSSAVLSWAREDVKARMYELLLADFQKPAEQRTADETLDYSWMQDVVRREGVDQAQKAVAEYNQFSGGPGYTEQGRANPNAPVTYGPSGSGYCRYHAPGPYDADYQGRTNYECFHPCESGFGCNPPYPTLDQFEAWGKYDSDESLSTDAVRSADMREVATIVSTGSAFFAAGVAAQALLALEPVLQGTALQLAVLPFAGKAVYDIGLTGEYLAAAWTGGFAAAAGVAAVAAAAIIAITLIVLRSLELNDQLSLPDQLDQAVTNASAWQPDLTAMATDTSGYSSRALLAIFVGATDPEPELLGCDPSSSPDPRHCVNPVPPCCASTQNFEVTPAGALFGTLTSTINSRDWGDERTQSSTVSYNWFIHAVTDKEGRTATVQSLRWRYVDWNGEHWTATMRPGSNGAHFFSVLDPSDWPAAAQSEPCTVADTCRDSTSVQFVDSSGGHATARLIGNPPIATDDAYAFDPSTGAKLAVGAPGVLANDTDPQGQTLISQLASPPQHGSVNLLADGSFQYVPTAGYSGMDSFDYTAVNTDRERSRPATVHLAIGTAATAVDDRYTTPPDTALVISAPGVEANDTIPDPDGLTACDLTDAAHGHVEGSGTLPGGLRVCGLHKDGGFTYDPDPGFNGVDSFTYNLRSANGRESNIATVTITIVAPMIPATIDIGEPVDGATYGLGSITPAGYGCSSPYGIVLCLGDVPPGAPFDTFHTGTHTFTVTALDGNFSSTTKTVHYTVADTVTPTVKIAVPGRGAVYRAGQTVLADYSCADLALVRCSSTIADQSPLDTSSVGTKILAVTGVDASGNRTRAAVRYHVVAGPPAVVATVAGTGQRARPGAVFATPLTARVSDSLGNPVAGYAADCAVLSGPAAFAAGAANAVVLTDAAGEATCPALRAGGRPGPVVTAVSAGPVSRLQAAVFVGTVVDPGAAPADAQVTISAPAGAVAGQPLTAHVVVTNSGPTDEGMYAVALALPASTRAIGGAGNRYRSTVILVGQALAVGARRTFTVVLRATSVRGPATLRAQVLGTSRDPRLSNNVASRELTIT